MPIHPIRPDTDQGRLVRKLSDIGDQRMNDEMNFLDLPINGYSVHWDTGIRGRTRIYTRDPELAHVFTFDLRRLVAHDSVRLQ